MVPTPNLAFWSVLNSPNKKLSWSLNEVLSTCCNCMGHERNGIYDFGFWARKSEKCSVTPYMFSKVYYCLSFYVRKVTDANNSFCLWSSYFCHVVINFSRKWRLSSYGGRIDIHKFYDSSILLFLSLKATSSDVLYVRAWRWSTNDRNYISIVIKYILNVVLDDCFVYTLLLNQLLRCSLCKGLKMVNKWPKLVALYINCN